MAINLPRGELDPIIDRIIVALRAYASDHPASQIDLYRQNSVSVRVRIVDRDFAGHNKVERSKMVWRYLDELPDDIQSDISMLVLLAPGEAQMSFANLDFSDPIPSGM